jgi:polar amino acid transport system substrate-binding protein
VKKFILLLVFGYYFIQVPIFEVELKFITPESLPWQYKTSEGMGGPIIRIIKRVCKEVNVTCHMIWVKSWSRAKKIVKTGNAHGLGVMKWAKGSVVSYSPPILKSEYGMFVKKIDSKKYKRIEDFSNYSISTHKPSATFKSLLKFASRLGKISISTNYNINVPIR